MTSNKRNLQEKGANEGQGQYCENVKESEMCLTGTWRFARKYLLQQKRFQNHAKHLRCNVLRKPLTTFENGSILDTGQRSQYASDDIKNYWKWTKKENSTTKMTLRSLLAAHGLSAHIIVIIFEWLLKWKCHQVIVLLNRTCLL